MAVFVINLGCMFEEIPKLNKKFDLIFADLPYNTSACSWDSALNLQEVFAVLESVLAKDSYILCTAIQPFTSKLVTSNLNNYFDEWIWLKNTSSNFLNCKRMTMRSHESVVVFKYGNPGFYPIKEEREPGSGNRKNIRGGKGTSCYGSFNRSTTEYEKLRFPRSYQKFKSERGLHPTQKPVSLVEYFIQTYSPPGSLVLDPCMGSGTTGVACHNTGRDFYGIEKDEKFFEIARTRLSSL